MSWLINTLITLVVVALIAGAAFVLYGRENTWQRLAGNPDQGPFDLTALVRSDRPHDALLCSPGLCEGVDADGALPVYEMTPEALIAALRTAIEGQPDRKRRVDDGTDPAALRFVTWTDTMRFPDTNQFLAIDLGDGRTGLVAYARAQVGYSDAGNNLARLQRWTSAIETGG